MMMLGRELGFVPAEYFGELNVCELLYQAGQLDAAAEHARRAIEIEERHPEVASRPTAVLRLARIEAYRGHDAAARGLLARIEESVGKARAEGRTSGALSAAEEVLVGMVDLATRDSTAAEWDALLDRSARSSVEQEPIEVAELRGAWAMRRGRLEEARRAYAEAMARARKIPHVMDDRLRRGLAACEGT
jgi:tetratricopeptide (TPR) repeat protein